jgi:Flp pilus assembly protein TadD
MAYWEAVRLQPNNPDYLKALAGTFERLQRSEEALAAFRDLAYLQPKDSTHLQMQAEMLWKLK